MLIALTSLPQAAAGGRLTFMAPDGWTSRPAASAMRVAEFVLPKADGDLEDAELIVYYFGGQGGDVEANITRWIGQMRQPDGKPSTAVAKRSSKSIAGLNVSLVDVAGTYVAEVRPGSADLHHKPGFQMRAAVVPTPKGPHFIKMLGPVKTMEKWGVHFTRFLETLRFEPGPAGAGR
jgi:hypothetical protein